MCHGASVAQRAACRSQASLPRGSYRRQLGCQAQWQVHLPTETISLGQATVLNL